VSNFVYQFLLGVGVNIVAASVFALVAWYLARIPDLTGAWTFELTISESTRPDYRGLKVVYVALISQDGQSINGVAEKVYECGADGKEYKYPPKGRMRSEIVGGLRGNVFQSREFHLLLREQGQIRPYATIQQVRKVRGDRLQGAFVSTAANSKGDCVWTRGLKHEFQNGLDSKNAP